MTKGTPIVSDLYLSPNFNLEELKWYVKESEQHSKHPLAKSVSSWASDTRFVTDDQVVELKELPGRGVQCTFRQSVYYLGSASWLSTLGCSIDESNEETRQFLSKSSVKAASLIYVANQSGTNPGNTAVQSINNTRPRFIGIIAITDEVHEHAKMVVSSLHERSICVHMITGDGWEAAKHVARLVGIREGHVHAALLPDQKAQVLKKLQSMGICQICSASNDTQGNGTRTTSGKYMVGLILDHLYSIPTSVRRRLPAFMHRTKKSKVAYVGDGVNDAVCLAQADVGISVYQASDVATSSSDVVCLVPGPVAMLVAYRLARHVMSKITSNLVWAFGFNSVCIPIASGMFYAWWHATISPELAAILMVLSSLTVVLNSLSINLY